MHALAEKVNWQVKWTIRKYADDYAFKLDEPFEVSEFDGNLLLNEGIAEMWDLIIGAGGTAYNNTNARIGVGDDNTAEVADQTDLIGTNTAYAGMETGYPSRSGQTVTFRSVFGSAEANFDWNEFVVDNGATAGRTMNRKVSAQGTKASGQTWTVDVQITLS